MKQKHGFQALRSWLEQDGAGRRFVAASRWANFLQTSTSTDGENLKLTSPLEPPHKLRMTKMKAGRSITPQSIWPWLGSYVVLRNLRKSGPDKGTWRVLFEVPARLRTSDWPPTIALPRAKPFCTGPDDLECILRIREEAAQLYEALSAGRDSGAPATLEIRKGSIPWLIRKWGGQRLLDAVSGDAATMDVALNPGDDGRDDWMNLDASTRAPYIRALRHVLAWSITVRHKHVRSIRPLELRDFLDRWKSKPGQRRNVRAMLYQIFIIAMEEGELTTNPLDAVKTTKRKRIKGGRRATVRRWSRKDVDAYAKTARTAKAWRAGRGGRDAINWPGGSIMVRLMYETAADSTDVITWKKGKGGNFAKHGKFRGIEFDRGKTGVPTFIPISDDLAREIEKNGSLYLVTDPLGRPYEPTKDDARMRGHLGTLRDHAVKAGAPRLVFDHLRHTAATEANEHGVMLDDIRHLTAHKDSSMNRQTYVQLSAEKTIEIQRARGLIK